MMCTMDQGKQNNHPEQNNMMTNHYDPFLASMEPVSMLSTMEPIPMQSSSMQKCPMLPSDCEPIPLHPNAFFGMGVADHSDRSDHGSETDPDLEEALPLDFEPSPYTVIFGRGKKCTESCGNRRLRVMISILAEKYSQAGANREKKSEIVTEVYSMVKDACPNQREAFVKFKDGRWYPVGEFLAREKISGLFRDVLHTKYRSSNKSKIKKRQERRQSLQKRGLSDASLSSLSEHT